MLRYLISQIARKSARQALEQRLPDILDKQIPKIVDDHLRKRFAECPHAQLSERGFGAAMSLALRSHRPDLDRRTALEWMWEYLDMAGVEYGDNGYEWTPVAAAELAKLYVQECGEFAA
jgi:hypothetical protein